jgi:hypothetical protein
MVVGGWWLVVGGWWLVVGGLGEGLTKLSESGPCPPSADEQNFRIYWIGCTKESDSLCRIELKQRRKRKLEFASYR